LWTIAKFRIVKDGFTISLRIYGKMLLQTRLLFLVVAGRISPHWQRKYASSYDLCFIFVRLPDPLNLFELDQIPWNMQMVLAWIIMEKLSPKYVRHRKDYYQQFVLVRNGPPPKPNPFSRRTQKMDGAMLSRPCLGTNITESFRTMMVASRDK